MVQGMPCAACGFVPVLPFLAVNVGDRVASAVACQVCTVAPIRAVCTQCGQHFPTRMGVPFGGRLHGYSMSPFLDDPEAAGAMGECPNCGGRSQMLLEGTWVHDQRGLRFTTPSESPLGRFLRRTADLLEELDGAQLRQLQEELAAAQRTDSREEAEAALNRRGLREVLELWKPETHEQFWKMIWTIIYVIMLVVGGLKADDLVERITDAVSSQTVVQKPQGEPPPAPSPDAEAPPPKE